MARPKAIIDWDEVDKHLQAQCDGVGIAGILGISPETLYRACKELHKIGFDAYSAAKKGEGKEFLVHTLSNSHTHAYTHTYTHQRGKNILDLNPGL